MSRRALVPLFATGRLGFVTFDAGTRPSDLTLNPLRVDAPDIRAWVESRDPRAVGNWNEIGRDEYGRAFTAARTAGADIIDDLYFAFADVVMQAGTERDFARLVTPTLKAKGWLKDETSDHVAYRLHLIYDTNLRLARGAGQWNRYQAAASGLPYLRGVTARDDRVRHPPKSRSDHTAFDGIILPIDHWFWRKWWTPLGFHCRCDIIQMTRSQLARFKNGVTDEASVLARDARLGTPIFASPAAPIEEQLAGMVAATNAARLPGEAAINPIETQRQGAAVWNQMLNDESIKALNDFLESIFGSFGGR